jgi:crotonobetainyl-CoA:carnitine CoA-transferase CaiB-like acyl-CoA transferase
MQMTPGNEKPQVYSRHLTGKKTGEQLARFNELLSGMMGSIESKPEVLSGITVIEVSRASFAGIVASTILAEFGAEVIKVEPPGGDPARKITPYGQNIDGTGLPFLMESRNKSYVTLDLSTEKGQENFRKLANKAAVIVDALKPGELDELGIGYRQLKNSNPGLVYVAISPYGHYTAKAEKLRSIPDSDLTAQSESGFPSITGDPREPEPFNYPLKAGIWAAWYMSAALAAAGALTALYFRQISGEGQMVDIATNDAITAWQGFQVVWGYTSEKPRDRIAGFDWCLYPYGFFKCKDGYVTVAAPMDMDFRSLLKLLNRWDLENDWRYLYDRTVDNIDKAEELRTELEKTLSKYTREELTRKALDFSAKAARDKLRSKGFPIIIPTKVPAEVVKEKHWNIRNNFVKVDDQKKGSYTVPAAIPKMSETPPRIKSTSCALGADNEKIFNKYGLQA